MSDEAAAILGIVILIIFFYGSPDLHDALIDALWSGTRVTEIAP